MDSFVQNRPRANSVRQRSIGCMAGHKYTYMLRIKGRNPNQISMERLAEYIREFAELIGRENSPLFQGIKKASTGIKAFVPNARRPFASHRMRSAAQNPLSKAGRVFRCLERMLGEDTISGAEVLSEDGSTIHVLHGLECADALSASVIQTGSVDGVVTGVLGSDDTVHLHMRDDEHRDVRLVIRDIAMAKKLLSHFRSKVIRVYAHGSWTQTKVGWFPDAKCRVERFEVIDDTPLSTVLQDLDNTEGNAWKLLEDPVAFWKELRGIH